LAWTSAQLIEELALFANVPSLLEGNDSYIKDRDNKGEGIEYHFVSCMVWAEREMSIL
jgi:hypothetical protein